MTTKAFLSLKPYVTSALQGLHLIDQPAESSNFLNKTCKVAFRSLARSDHKGRKSVRKALAEDILQRGKTWKNQVNWRQFALMHCPGIIRETSLEGGQVEASVKASLEFTKLCLAKEGLFFSVDDVPEVTFLDLHKTLGHFNDLLIFRPEHSDQPTKASLIEKNVIGFLETIKDFLPDSPNGIYLPLGYRHGTKNQGHAIACKIQEKNEEVIISIFNLGNGSEPHPVLDYTLNQKKTSFSFFPIAIPKKIFFSDVGKMAFCQIFRYLADAPMQHEEGYDGHDLYDIFFQFLYFPGTGRILKLPKQEEYESDSQISGNCAEIAVKCVMEDMLIQHGVSKIDRRKIALNKEFCSLIAAYHAFVENPSCHPSARELLMDAAKSFGAEILDFHAKKQISEQEFIGAQAVVHEIVRAAKKTPYAPLAHQSAIPIIPDFNPLFDSIPSLEEISFPEETSTHELEQIRFEPPTFKSMESLPKDLKKWVITAINLPPKAAFDYVADCLKQLPIPVSRDPRASDDLWNLITQNQVADLLSDLEELLRQGLRGEEVSKPSTSRYEISHFADQFLMVYSVLAIGDKLARLCEDSKLEGYSCPFLPSPFKFEPFGFTSLPLREDNERFTEIFSYLTGKKYQSDKGYKDKTIFPVAPVINVRQFVGDLLSGNYSQEGEQGKNHVEYLARLLPVSADATESHLAAHYCANWMKILPPQVRSLYYFSFLSHVLFSAPGMPFPSSLNFTETSVAGKAALKIENPYFDPKMTKPKDTWARDDQIYLFGADHRPQLDVPIQDKRFEEFQPRPEDVNFRFVDLNSPEMRALMTNDAICYMLAEQDRKDWAIDEPSLRTVLYDTRKGNLALWQALQDFSSIENHYLLSHPGVQKALDSCFFQPRFLLERLKEEPEPIIEAFRGYVAEGLRHYNNNHAQLDGILFLLRQGITFESYTPRSAKREETLAFYQKSLDLLLQGKFEKDSQWIDIYSHLIFLQVQSDTTNPEELFFTIFRTNLLFPPSKGTTWLRSCLPRLVRTAAYKYSAFLIDEESRSALCRRIVTALIPDQEILQQLPSGTWGGNFPQFRCGDLVIDFSTGQIGSIKYRGTLRKFEFWAKDEDIGVPQHKYGKLFWIGKNEVAISLNGKLKYHFKLDRWTELLSDSMGTKETEIHRFRDIQEIDELDQDFLNHTSYLPFAHYRQEDGSIISHDIQTKKPYFLMERHGRSIVYRRLNEAGKQLPFVLAKLSKIDRSDPLYRYTVRYVPPGDVLCFVDESQKMIHELNFYKLRLQFTHDGRGLSWNQNPQFYLIGDENDLTTTEEKAHYIHLRKELNEYDGAMILYNPTTKKWNVIIPNTDFARVIQKGEDFSKDVEPSKSSYLSKYFQFEFDPVEKSLRTLKSDHNQSYAYLALLFKMKRDCEKSSNYLSRVRTTSFFDTETLNMLERFTNLSDYSPASIAFNLKLSLFVIKNKNLMLEKQFAHQKSHWFYPKFLRWAIENYKLYLSEQGARRIPEKMRLSDGEKMMLILAFRRCYQEDDRQDKEGLNWEGRWKKEQPILDAQYNVFFSAQRQNTLLPPTQEISIIPPVLADLRKPDSFYDSSADFIITNYEKYHGTKLKAKQREALEIADYPVRVTEEAIAAHFPQLYEEARRSPPDTLCSFDFKLQAFLKANNASKSSYLGHLLFWVRHFPEQFTDCPLGEPPQKEVLIEIFQRMKAIPRTAEKRYSEIEKQLKAKIPFKIERSIPLSAPREQFQNVKVLPAPPRPTPVDLKDDLQQLEKQIYRLFNSPYKLIDAALAPDEVEREMCFLMSKDSAQTLSFSPTQGDSLPETLMKQVILKNNLNYLCKHRPMLKLEQMQFLCQLVNEWYHTRVLFKLKEEGNEGLYIPYDYQQYPEISYFFLKTGKFPRPERMKTYFWVMDRLKAGRKCHFQLPAGAGKTDILTPLLNLGAKRLGLLPVTCVTQSIYPVDKENLSYNLRTLDEDLCYLEVGIHMINQLSSLDLEFIFSQLMQYKSEGKSLIITRHTYDALYLIRDLALKSSLEEEPLEDEEKLAHLLKMTSTILGSVKEQEINESNIEAVSVALNTFKYVQDQIEKRKEIEKLREERGLKIRYAQNILNFFEDHSVLICDESHQNGDALTRAIFGTGELATIPQGESRHLLTLMKPLLGKLPEAPSVEEVNELRMSLARSYLDLIPGIPPEAHPQILDFWTNLKAPQPKLLKVWAADTSTREKANLISLTSHFLLDLLPDVLALRTDVDHARSLYPTRKYDVPARNKQPSTAEYDDRYRTCVLTIKGNYGRGLYEDDIRQLLTDMLKACEDEKVQGFHPENTPSNIRFKEWIEKTPLKDQNPQRLEDIQFSNSEMMRTLHTHLSKHPDVIEYFIIKYGFEGIGAPTQQLSCTTTDVFNGFRGCVSFSATPREDIAYPRCITEFLRDPQFEAKVQRKWQEPQNRGILYVENEEDFFNQMKTGLHLEETILIDPRGFFSSPGSQVAKKWLENNPSLEGVLYVTEARSTDVDRNEKISLLLRDGKVIQLNGSNIVTALKEHDLDWEKLKLGTIYGPGQTESANILQKPNAKACFFLGEGLTTSHAIQALMRMRGFLDLDQTVTNLLPRALGRKIFRTEESVEAIQQWTDENARKQEEKRIVLNAFQEIYFAIARKARLKIRQTHARDSSPTMQHVIAAYKEHAPGLIEFNAVDAYEAFGEHEVLKKTRKVLNLFAVKTYARFKYDVPFDGEAVLQEEIEAIISAVEKRIARISTSSEKQTSKEIEQHLQLKTEAQREQHKVVPRPVDPLSLEGQYGTVKIYSPEYLNGKKTLARDVFGTDFLCSNFYLRSNHLRTAKLTDTSDPSTQYLKPIHFFVILITPEGTRAEVDSHEIIDSDQDDLLSCPETVKDLQHRAFMISANGKLVQRGKGALAPTQEELERIMSSPWLKDLILDAALLNGRIPYPDALYDRIQKAGWDTFETLWNKIVAALPNPERAHTRAFGKLKERYLRENADVFVH
jgi:hypothetical protein